MFVLNEFTKVAGARGVAVLTVLALRRANAREPNELKGTTLSSAETKPRDSVKEAGFGASVEEAGFGASVEEAGLGVLGAAGGLGFGDATGETSVSWNKANDLGSYPGPKSTYACRWYRLRNTG
jgi:hypothetical protein